MTDVVSLSDAEVEAPEAIVTDALTISDSLASSTEYVRSLTDIVSLSDVSVESAEAVLTDEVSISDSLT